MPLPKILPSLSGKKKINYSPVVDADPIRYSPDQKQDDIGAFTKISRAFKNQVKDHGYGDEMMDLDANPMKKRVRSIMQAATKDNPFARRLFDSLTSKGQKPIDTKKKAPLKKSKPEKELPKKPQPVSPELAPQTEPAAPAVKPKASKPSKLDEIVTGKESSLLTKVITKLEEIKEVLVGTDKGNLDSIDKTLKTVSKATSLSNHAKAAVKLPGVQVDPVAPEAKAPDVHKPSHVNSGSNATVKQEKVVKAPAFKWYNDGQTIKKVPVGQTAPEGFKPGRLKFIPPKKEDAPEAKKSRWLTNKTPSSIFKAAPGVLKNPAKMISDAVRSAVGPKKDPVKMPEVVKPGPMKLATNIITGNEIPDAVQSTAANGPGSLLGDVVSSKMGKGLAGRILPTAKSALPAAGRAVMAGARFVAPAVAPAAAVAGAGYAGYKAGGKLNEAMDGTKVGQVRDGLFDSALSGIDNMTGGAISGNKEIAADNWKNSWLGSKFTKDSKTLDELYGKNKDAKKNIESVVPALSKELETQGIATTDKEKAMVYGQLATETGGFRKMEEGKYSADRVWALRGKQLEKQGVSLDDLKKAESSGGKDAMYEYMYGDKYRTGSNKMGNVEEGDAAKFKGRGLVQLTGRNNYEKASKDLGIDLVSDPDLIMKDPEVNAKVTAWHMKNNKSVMAGLKSGDIDKVSQGINGGVYGKSHGRDDRIAQTEKIANKMASAEATPVEVASLDKPIASSVTSDKLEKVSPQVTSADRMEAETFASKSQAAQPVIIQQQTHAPQQVASTGPASTPAAPMIPRNPDNSINRITDSQMGYGIA